MRVALSSRSAVAVDVDHWGLEAHGADTEDALARLGTVEHDRFSAFHLAHGDVCEPVGDIVVIERSEVPDEGAFDFERGPATVAERDRTLELHSWARSDLMALIEGATEDELDWVDPERTLPEWAWWRTARQMAWHCAIAETRYYLGRLGVSPPQPFAELTSPFPVPATGALLELMEISAAHVQHRVHEIDADLFVATAGETWTTRKSLRLLAGHERGENEVTAALVAGARGAAI